MELDQLAIDLAGRISDGDPVDWMALEAQGGRLCLPLRPLQVLEAVHQAFRLSGASRSSRPPVPPRPASR